MIKCSTRRPLPALPPVTGTHVGSTITMLLAAEMGLLRHALVSLLSRQEGITVVAAVADVATALTQARRLSPDVVVIDLDHPEMSELATIQELRAHLPSVPIVALVRTEPIQLLRTLLTAEPLIPALAIVDKNGPATRLVHAVRAVVTGEMVIDTTVALAALTAAPNPLTTREREILRLVAGGASNQEISTRLHLASGTVRNYLSSAITKTRARNRIDAVRLARNAGWL